MRRARRKLRDEGGYTLTEMLVVIGIIGLIAAALTPGLIGQLGRAKAKTAQLQLDTVASAVENFHADVGRYPTSDEGLKALITEPSGADGWTGPYLRDKKVLNDPWGRPVVYIVDQDHNTFVVKSYGAEGKPGGRGVNRELQAPAAP
jgi:general secretion pathway protein G